MRVGPVENSRILNLGTFQSKPLQGRDLSKVEKNFCPVSIRFREVPLYFLYQSNVCQMTHHNYYIHELSPRFYQIKFHVLSQIG